MDAAVSLIKFIALACAGGFSILGVMTEFKKEGRVTRWGRVAIIGVVLSTLLSVALLSLEQRSLAESRRKADLERIAADDKAAKEREDANQKFSATVGRLDAIRGSVNDSLEQTSRNLAQTRVVAEDVKRSIQEQSRIVAQTKGIARNLATSLESQQRQLTQTENLALDRDLDGLELSWRPSDAQWAEIVRAYDRLPSGNVAVDSHHIRVPDKVYFHATTITGERFYEHWRIIFKPLLRPQGLIEFPPVLTSQAGWDKFFQVLSAALPSYLTVKLGSNPGFVLSAGGFYPSSISISRNKITLLIKPPETKLSLKMLTEKTVTFSGWRGVDAIHLKSKDPGVCLDQTINLDWGEPTDEFEPARSGPHELNLQFANLSQCQQSGP